MPVALNKFTYVLYADTNHAAKNKGTIDGGHAAEKAHIISS